MDKSDLIRSLVSNQEVLLKCPKEYEVSDKKAGTESGCVGCPYLIKSAEHLNCAVIAWSFGPFSQIETAEMLKMGQSSVSETETAALQKLKYKISKIDRYKDILFELGIRENIFLKQQESMQADIDILEALMEKYDKKHT